MAPAVLAVAVAAQWEPAAAWEPSAEVWTPAAQVPEARVPEGPVPEEQAVEERAPEVQVRVAVRRAARPQSLRSTH